VPAGFAATSITFVSPRDGFVLGDAPCVTPPCTVILRTSDTGKTWHRIGAPPVLLPASAGDPGDPTSARSIRFATTDDGWVFGPDLWAAQTSPDAEG